LATAFCPPEFTISQLRRVYETVWNTRLDPGNFHRKVKNTTDFVQLVGAYSDPGEEGGRPAEMYIPGPALMLDSPLDRGVPVPLRDSDAEGDPLP
jgi:8-oxo-dGTP diphosphatase